MDSQKKYPANIELQTENIEQDNKGINTVLSVEYFDSPINEEDADDEASYNYSTSSTNHPLERISKYYKQTYRKAWEMMPDFKGWLTGIEGQPLRAYCLYCQKSLHAHRLSLLKHTCTIRHQKAAEFHRFQKTKLKGVNYVNVKTRKNEIGNLEGTDADMIEDGEAEEEEEEEEGNEGALEEIEDADYAEEIIPIEGQTLELDFDGNSKETYETEHKYNNYSTDTATIQMASISDSGADKSVSAGRPYNNPSTGAVVTTVHKTPISTHVLDTSRGQPVMGLQVSLYRLINGRWTYINEGVTNSDGRCSQLLEKGEFLTGRYKLHFDVDKYFEAQKIASLYPFIEIVFDCKDNGDNINYHIPLLLNPFGYTTYRGS